MNFKSYPRSTALQQLSALGRANPSRPNSLSSATVSLNSHRDTDVHRKAYSCLHSTRLWLNIGDSWTCQSTNLRSSGTRRDERERGRPLPKRKRPPSFLPSQSPHPASGVLDLRRQRRTVGYFGVPYHNYVLYPMFDENIILFGSWGLNINM